MKGKTREGKKQGSLGKKSDNEPFSIFNNKKTVGQKKTPGWKAKSPPLISKEQRNEILRALNNGKKVDIKL